MNNLFSLDISNKGSVSFQIAENDNLPDKICFRCSAKVEELYEFIQKCVKTQNNLHSSMGKQCILFNNTKERVLWEDKLNKCSLSNDAICDDLIKNAMEGIKYTPLEPKVLKDEVKQQTKQDNCELSKLDTKNVDHKIENSNGNDIIQKNMKLSIDKVDKKGPLESNTLEKPQDSIVKNNKKSKSETHKSKINESKINDPNKDMEEKNSLSEDKNKLNGVNNSDSANKQVPFNIMDHVIKLKVNGVGTLFQCQLCNKNFLKIEVVESHGCAKNGAPRPDFARHIPAPQPPKMPSIKYIKIDSNLKKNKDAVVDNSSKAVDPKKTEKVEQKLPQPSPNPLPKLKPKVGPASRVKKQPSPENVTGETQTANTIKPQVIQTIQPAMNIAVNQAAPTFPVMSFPVMPKPNSRYSFVPGPNNTFTLVEDQSNIIATLQETTSINSTSNVPTPNFHYSTLPIANIPYSTIPTSSISYPNIQPRNIPYPTIPTANNSYPTVPTSSIHYPIIPTPNTPYSNIPTTNAPLSSIPTSNNITPAIKKQTTKPGPKSKKRPRPPSPEVIDLDDEQSPDQPPVQSNQLPNLQISQTPGQPYPVGLFKTANPASFIPPPVNQLPAFATPAMKKQLYTVVQTGNPSKLLISTKPMPTVEESPKKRTRKSKHEVKETDQLNTTLQNPTLAKSSDNFTFINVDPFVEPKYVLPTDSIQESQISTSTQVLRNADKKDKDNSNKLYSCNMCSERFSREKKLLSHIQSHYTKMDEEDQMREKTKKKKTRI